MRHYAHIPTSARPAILAAARHLFAERGFAGTSMREIAEAAGVSKAAIYHHFRDKRRLYRELLDEGITTLTAAMRRLPDEGPARAQLARILLLHLEFARAHADLLRMMVHEQWQAGAGGRGGGRAPPGHRPHRPAPRGRTDDLRRGAGAGDRSGRVQAGGTGPLRAGALRRHRHHQRGVCDGRAAGLGRRGGTECNGRALERTGRAPGCASRGRRIVHRKGEDRVRRRWFWIILIIVLLIAAGLTAGRMRAPKAAPVQQAEEVIPVEVAPVEPATLERTVEVSGSLTSARMTEVQPRRSGPAARGLVGGGEDVEGGRAPAPGGARRRRRCGRPRRN